MLRYLVKRAVTAVPVFFGITVLVFFMMNLTSGTVADLAGGELGASGGADRAALELRFGLDQPLPARYLSWLAGLLRGDLGESYRTGERVAELIGARVGATLTLTGSGIALALLLGVPLGVLAAWKPRSGWDRAAGAAAMVSFSTPGFLLCLGAIWLFSVKLGWLPASGMVSAGGGGAADLLRHLILPASVVCVSSLGSLVKQTRSACLETLDQDYILLSRAKGARESAVVVRHGLRNALIPVCTTIFGHIPHILGGSVVVERIFGWPGIGSLFFSSIASRDYPVIMGETVLIALAVLATYLLLDIVYVLADPRVRLRGR